MTGILEFEFMEAFWGPLVATLAMLFGAFLGWLILKWSRRIAPSNPGKEKNRTYGCGEIVKSEETQADAEQFYSPIREVFGRLYDYVRPGHSGKLNTYLLWILSGFIIILGWIIVQLG